MTRTSSTDPNAAIVTAMVCAGAVGAQFIAGKATRDALYLGALDVTSLPMIIVVTAICSMGLVAVSSLALRHVAPAVVVPAAFVVNAALLMLEWNLIETTPEWAARAMYLHFSGLGPILGSGFWLIATDLFDPRTARRHFGRIAGVSTLSGLAGALVAERMAAHLGVGAMLPILAALSLLGGWQVRRLGMLRSGSGSSARPPRNVEHDGSIDGAPDLLADSPQSGLRALSRTSYLRNLATLVLLGTAAAALVDYVFKVRAVDRFGDGDTLLRFFAMYYAGTSLIAFVIQTTSSARALERLGLGLTASSPSLALVIGGLGGMWFTGIGGALVARAGESVFRGSLFRTSYELFFTPIPSAEKRAAKSIIDVGFDRLGDALGGGLIRLLIVLPAVQRETAILAGAVACSAAALVVARSLHRGYVHTLERSLINRAVELDLDDVTDLTTRTTLLRTIHSTPASARARTRDSTGTAAGLAAADPEVQGILALRSRDRDRTLAVLRGQEPLPRALVAHVIPLLAWDPVADDAIRALRRIVEEHVGELTDALVDPSQPFATRRRLARVFAAAGTQRAVDALLIGLDDLRFEVRFQCGRSLSGLLARHPHLRVDAERVFDVVRREVAVGRPVWESHRLLDGVQADEAHAFVDEFIKDRTSQSLGHVFTLLSLVLPATPLQIAYRGLHTTDAALRGTALEYLEEVLPPDIRERLWPFLGDGPHATRQGRSRSEILADLLRSNESIELNLEEIRRARQDPKLAAGSQQPG